MAKKTKLPPEVICLSDDDKDYDNNNNTNTITTATTTNNNETDIQVKTPEKQPDSPIIISNDKNKETDIQIETPVKQSDSATIVSNDNNNETDIQIVRQPDSPIIVGNDNNNDENIQTKTPVEQPESSIITNNDNNNDCDQLSNWTIDEEDILHLSKLPSKYNDIYKKPFEIRCSSIRFGIVEFNVETEVVLMKEIEFEMKLLGGFSEQINLKLAYSDVIKFYFSFQSETPAAFIQVRNEFALLFDRYIPSSDESGKCFDPKSKDERRRSIVFHLKKLTTDMERIHGSTIYYFLQTKCPKIDICCLKGSRAQNLYNSTRYAKSSSPFRKKPFKLSPNDLIAKTVGLNKNTTRFHLSSDDLFCLNEGEYLNDSIIDFYLQYIYYEKLTEEDRRRTYLFNSFFYTRLTQKDKCNNTNMSDAEQRYNHVKRWFRHEDLFSKDYLIVPINQNAHWYIVLIQNHKNVLTARDLINDNDDDNKTKSKKKRRLIRRNRSSKHSKISRNSSSKSNSTDDLDNFLSDDEPCLKINIESLVNSTTHSQSPSIIIFDSLGISSKNRVAAILREFLQLEYDHKKSSTIISSERKVFNTDTIPTIEADVPQQQNYVDCGLYILQYIESFFSHQSSPMNFQFSSTFSNRCEKNLKGSSKRKEILNVINQHVIVKND